LWFGIVIWRLGGGRGGWAVREFFQSLRAGVLSKHFSFFGLLHGFFLFFFPPSKNSALGVI
ncbi:hypothetical protein ACNITZ_28045, partial [Escherichia coli]